MAQARKTKPAARRRPAAPTRQRTLIEVVAKLIDSHPFRAAVARDAVQALQRFGVSKALIARIQTAQSKGLAAMAALLRSEIAKEMKVLRTAFTKLDFYAGYMPIPQLAGVAVTKSGAVTVRGRGLGPRLQVRFTAPGRRAVTVALRRGKAGADLFESARGKGKLAPGRYTASVKGANGRWSNGVSVTVR